MKYLNQVKAFLWRIWAIRLWFFKFYMHIFIRIYWIFVHSTFGQITFVPFFWISILISDEYPVFVIFYMYMTSMSLSLFIICRFLPPVWLKSTFGEEQLTKWVGTPLNAIKRHGVGIAAYFLLRSADNLINDYRVERKAGAMVEHLDKSGGDFKKTPAELERIWDKAEKSVGPSFTKRLETGVSEAVKGAVKGVFHDGNRD